MTFDAGAIEARLILDRTPFQRELAAARAEGADFEKNAFTAKMNIDNREALNSIRDVQNAWDALREDLTKANVINLDNGAANRHIIETQLLFEQLRETLQQNINLKPNIDLGNLSNFAQQAQTQFLGEDITIDVSAPGASQAAQQLDNVAGAVDKVTHSTTGFGFGIGLLNKEITLWGGLFGSVHMLGMIQLWHILLDSVIATVAGTVEATLALTDATVAAAPGVEDIYTHLKSVDDVSKALGVDIPPVTGHLREVGQAFASLDIEALGGGLNLLQHGGNTFQDVAIQVGTGIDDVLAKLDLWNAAQAHTGMLARDGADVLSQLAHIAGQVFLAFDNLVKADPGTVHFLLDVLEGASSLLDILSKIPTPILFTALAVHSFVLWGGLITSIVNKILGPLSPINFLLSDTVKNFLNLGKGAEEGVAAASIPLVDLRANLSKVEQDSSIFERSWSKITDILTSPGAFVIGAAAVGYLAYQMTQADGSAKALVASLNQKIDSESAASAILNINQAIGTLDNQIKTFPIAENQRIADSVNNAYGAAGRALKGTVDTSKSFGQQVLDVGKTFIDSLTGIGDQAAGIFHTTQIGPSVDLFKGTITNLTREQDNLFRETGKLMGQGHSYSQALALMDDANVRANDSFAVMQQKVKNLITGWQDMSVQGNILGSGINAITFAEEQQNSQITQLTGGWDAFMKLVTGSDTAFLSFEQSVQGIGQAARGIVTIAGGATSASGRLTTATVRQHASMTGLNQASITLRQSWESSLSAAGQYFDALTQQASAAGLGESGTKLLISAGKDLVAQLIPQARQSKEAADQLYAFAQIAGYTGPNSLKRLTEWLGNTHGAAKNLDYVTQLLTGDSANLLQDVQNLAKAINEQLNQAMSAAIFQAGGGQKVFDNFANAVLYGHGNVQLLKDSAQALADKLVNVLGNTAQAKQEFMTFAEQLHLTKQQAQDLWNQLSEIKPIHESISVNGVGNWRLTQMTGNAGPQPGVGTVLAPGAASGMLITTGTGPTSDDNIIRVSKGETVVPADLTPKYAPYFAADGIPGFSGGGFIGNYSGGWPGLGSWTLGEYHKSINAVAQTTAEAISEAVKKIANFTAPFGSGASGSEMANGVQLYNYLLRNLFNGNRIATAGAIASIWGESTWNPFAQGTGGRGLIGWTPPSTISDAAFSGGMATQLPAILAFVVNSGDMGVIESMMNAASVTQAAWEWGRGVERFGIPDVHPEGIALATQIAGLAKGGRIYDDGGLVGPGAQMIVNGTGRNEYMLHPDASDALLHALRSGVLSSGGKGPLIGQYNTNYYGTGDVRDAMNELLFVLRRANLEIS